MNRMLSFAPSATTMRSNGRIIVRPTPIDGTVHGGDDRLGRADEVDPVAVALRHRRPPASPWSSASKTAPMSAPAQKPRPAPGHDDGAHRRVGVGRLDGVGQLGASCGASRR